VAKKSTFAEKKEASASDDAVQDPAWKLHATAKQVKADARNRLERLFYLPGVADSTMDSLFCHLNEDLTYAKATVSFQGFSGTLAVAYDAVFLEITISFFPAADNLSAVPLLKVSPTLTPDPADWEVVCTCPVSSLFDVSVDEVSHVGNCHAANVSDLESSVLELVAKLLD
jgi:hypothetical protein